MDQGARLWLIGLHSSVPAGVTFTYPQHPVPVEGDIVMPSNELFPEHFLKKAPIRIDQLDVVAESVK